MWSLIRYISKVIIVYFPAMVLSIPMTILILSYQIGDEILTEILKEK